MQTIRIKTLKKKRSKQNKSNFKGVSLDIYFGLFKKNENSGDYFSNKPNNSTSLPPLNNNDAKSN